MNRRQFVSSALKTLAVLPFAAVFLAACKKKGGGLPAGEKLVTDIPENTSLTGALQYAAASTKPGQNCANCNLYTKSNDGYGKCQLFSQGVVGAEAWCSSWQAKPVS